MANRRIAIFGTSRSGKDHTIKGAVPILWSHGKRYGHVSLIGQVHNILDGNKLSHMNEPEKEELMKAVRKEIDDLALKESIFVDEHYCFPKTYGGKTIHNQYVDEKLPYREVYDKDLDRTYEVVFKDYHLNGYDAVYYLDINSETLLDRFRNSEAEKRNEEITKDDIHSWKQFERFEIQRLCDQKDVPFIRLTDPSTISEELATDLIRRFES